jgi:TRAP-type C4-dicarboxylate transport system permease small subunit
VRYLDKFTNFLEKIVNRISQAANTLGLAFLVIMAILTFVDVAGRALFNRPVTGAFEFTQVLVVMVVALAIAYTGVLKRHIHIDILASKFPIMAQKVLFTIDDLISAGMFSLVTWGAVFQAQNMQRLGETTGVMDIKLFPFVWVLAFGSALLTLVYLVDFLHSFSKAVRH